MALTVPALWMVLAVPAVPEAVRSCLLQVQHDLFNLGGELCIPGYRMVQAAAIERLERELDAFNEPLPVLKEFILPGGGPAAAACHVARTVVRRAERRVLSLAAEEPVAEEVLQYLNRLSDLLFVLTRVLNRHAGGQDVLWQKGRSKG
jgi:cob(I)alamin adenosyltransferase